VPNPTKNEIRPLIKDLKKDPDASFPRFYELTKEKTFYLIFSYVRNATMAEDILQDTYISFLRALGKISVRLNPLSYLYATARNRAIDYLRDSEKVVNVEDETLESISPSEFVYEDPDGLLKLIAAILSPFEFRVYTLHVLGDLTFKEIGKIVKRPTGTLTYTYSLAIQKLRKGLTENGEQRI